MLGPVNPDSNRDLYRYIGRPAKEDLLKTLLPQGTFGEPTLHNKEITQHSPDTNMFNLFRERTANDDVPTV